MKALFDACRDCVVNEDSPCVLAAGREIATQLRARWSDLQPSHRGTNKERVIASLYVSFHKGRVFVKEKPLSGFMLLGFSGLKI